MYIYISYHLSDFDKFDNKGHILLVKENILGRKDDINK